MGQQDQHLRTTHLWSTHAGRPYRDHQSALQTGKHTLPAAPRVPKAHSTSQPNRFDPSLLLYHGNRAKVTWPPEPCSTLKCVGGFHAFRLGYMPNGSQLAGLCNFCRTVHEATNCTYADPSLGCRGISASDRIADFAARRQSRRN